MFESRAAREENVSPELAKLPSHSRVGPWLLERQSFWRHLQDTIANRDGLSLSECARKLIRRDSFEKKCIMAAPEVANDYELNPDSDIAGYISRWNPEYRENIEDLCMQLRPMDPECKISVCIPAAGHEEARYVYRALQSFSEQTLAAKQFEIVMLVNFPSGLEPERQKYVAETAAVIQTFKNDFPDLAVNVAYAEMGGKFERRIGFLRSLATDLAVFRHGQSMRGGDHVLVACDADTRGVERGYLENFLRRFEQHPHVDAFAGNLSWSPEKAVVNPLLFVNQTFYEIMMAGRRIYDKERVCCGPNFAMRASSYSLLNGYDATRNIAEDVDMYFRFFDLRAGSGTHVGVKFAGLNSRLYTSTRRAEEAMKTGSSLIHQWSNLFTEFGDSNAHVRFRGEAIQDGRYVWRGDEQFLKDVERLINRSMRDLERYFEDVHSESPAVEKALTHYLGLQYKAWPDGYISIVDGSKFLERIKDMRENGLARWHKRLNRAVEFSSPQAP